MSESFKFANRTNWSLTPNKIFTVLNELREQQAPVIDLTESNPTQCQFEYPPEGFTKSLSGKENLVYDPDAKGLLKAREAVRDYYRSKNKDIPLEHIFLTSSTSEAYTYIFRLLTNPNEHILFPRPSYPLFQFLSDINDVQMDHYSLKYDDQWQLDFNSLEKNISDKTKAVVIVNPNNPTGNFMKTSELRYLNKICEQESLAIIGDEVFHDFAMDQSFATSSLAGQSDVLTFIMGGLSKTVGLPQMKLSWVVISGPGPLAEDAIKRLEIIADTYLSVNTPVQNTLHCWLQQREGIQNQIKARVAENYRFLKEQSEKTTGCRLLNTEGGWYAVLSIPGRQTEEWWVLKLLTKYHVFVHPGYFFDFEDGPYLVLSLLPVTNRFQEGVLRLLSRIEQEAS